ncbi:50S ribosomal protein L21, mitochondrial-like [Asparagus officinalis]|nr:50S ribosomal protein L21, mitochondrial-like [Asparagus officinalis]
MASQRRLTLTLTHYFRSLLSSSPPPPPSLIKSQTLTLRSLHLSTLKNPHSNSILPLYQHQPIDPPRCRHFSSRPSGSSGDDDEDDENEEDGEYEEEEEEDDDDEGDESCNGSVKKFGASGKSEEEKANEAADIGYRVIGPLDPSERPFKPWEPVFAVVQIGSHQFKVSNGDSIFTERLKFCDVNDKLILNKVLMLGSKSQTIIGRPILPEAIVHAVVEEHALDAKVIIFKKKRRKNYRRTKGHRQELTKLRITDIQGVEKSEDVAIAA